MKRYFSLCFALLMGCLSSCALDSADRGGNLKVQFAMPKSSALPSQTSRKVSPASTLTAPGSVAAFTCIAINVTGPGIADSSGNPEPNLGLLFDRLYNKIAYCSYRGVIRGPFATVAGLVQEANLAVPTGGPRLVQVIGLIERYQNGVLSNDCQAEFNPGIPQARDANGAVVEADAYELGRATLDGLFQDQIISVSMDYNTLTTPERDARSVKCGSI